MAYNQPQNPPQGWSNPGAPPAINTTGGYPPGNQQQSYQAPQFSPPPPSPDKNGGNMLKTLNFFSSKPSFTPVSNAGATTLTSPVVGTPGGYFPQQGFGTTGSGPAPPLTTYNSNPIPTYSPSVGGPAGYQPVNPPTQQYPAVPLPGQYGTNQPQVVPGQQNPQPQQQAQPFQHPQPQQQHQPQHQQQHQHQHHPQHQQPQQNYQQNPPPAHSHPQQHQGSQGFNAFPTSDSPAPPPAYSPPQNGYGAGPDKPTIQSHLASAQANPTSHPPSHQHTHPTSTSNQHLTTQNPPNLGHNTQSGQTHPPAGSNQHLTTQNPPNPGHNAQSGHTHPPSTPNQHSTTQNLPNPGLNAQSGQPPSQTPQGNSSAPTSGSPAVINNAEPDGQYWHALVEDSKLPMGPNPTMRSLFRGIAACINKECIVDHSPPCILSPTKLSMYYATLLTYSERQTKLFSKARTHPSILTDLYNKLNCQHLLIPHPIGDGKRRPPLPALTIDGFEHWMLIQVLLNPDEEYQRLISFLQAPNRVVIDPATQRPIPTTSIPRSAFPATPNDWVVKRYGGLLENALNSTGGRAEEIEEVPDIEGARRELAYFKQRSSETQSETHKTQAELVSTRKELDWIKTKLTGVQSEEESTRKRAAEKDGEIEWLKKRLAETQAELDSSKNEVEGLRRLNSARSGSVSSVSSVGTPYPTGERAQGARPPYPVSATPAGTGSPAPSQGNAYYRQRYRPST